MNTPDGKAIVMLARADASLPIEVGSTLSDGYVVKRIGPDAIRLAFPPTGTEIDLPIPPAPNP